MQGRSELRIARNSNSSASKEKQPWRNLKRLKSADLQRGVLCFEIRGNMDNTNIIVKARKTEALERQAAEAVHSSTSKRASPRCSCQATERPYIFFGPNSISLLIG